MDVQATIDRMIQAIEEGEREEAAQAARDVAAWVRKGGFMPKLTAEQSDSIFSAMGDLIETLLCALERGDPSKGSAIFSAMADLLGG